MVKLKFGRNVNIKLKSRETVTVPKDEIWKGMLSIDDTLRLNDNQVAGARKDGYYIGYPFTTIIGGGATLEASSYSSVFSGIAFKIVEEVSNV